MIYLHTATASLILFTIALLVGKQKKLSDYILISWLLVFLSNMAAFIVLTVYLPPFNLLNNLLLEFSDTSVLLHGPIFWFYTRSLTERNFRFKGSDSLQLLPFVFAIILRHNVSLYSDDNLIHIVKWITLLKFISLLVYTIMVFMRVREHQKKVTHIFSNTENKFLGWLRFVSLGVLTLWLIGFFSNILEWINFSTTYKSDGVLFQTSTDCFIIVMTYFGFQQKSVYDVPDKPIYQNDDKYPQNSVIEESLEINDSPSVKYQKSGLEERRSKEIHSELLKLMEVKEIYKDEDLTLYKLAGMLKVSPNHLSQVINSIEGRSFFDFINFYRIEAVKNIIILKGKEHLTILGIAYECGFNSKAAFHRAFKKFTGTTPSEYKRNASE